MSTKKRPNGFFKDMSNQEFMDFIKDNYNGLSLKELNETDSSVYSLARRRRHNGKRILDLLIDNGILNKERRSLMDLSDNDLKSHIKEKYFGKTVTELIKSDGSLAAECYDRDIIDNLVEKGILIREKPKQGFFKKMTNEEIISYLKENHNGDTIAELRNNSIGCYRVAIERGIIDKLVDSGIIIREKYPKGYFSAMNNEEFIEYTKEHFNGMSLYDFMTLRWSAYHEAINKKVLDKLINDGIIIRKKRSNDFFSSMTDQELINFVKTNYKGKTLGELSRNTVYFILNERKLTDSLVNEGIIIRGNIKRNYKDFQNVERDLNALIAKYGYLPKAKEISKDNSYLISSIQRYHGGYRAVKERILSSKKELENLLEEYIGGNE